MKLAKLFPFAILILVLSFSVKAKANSTVILFLGDSLTEGYGVASEEAYARVIADKLKRDYPEQNLKVIKDGINGATSASALGRLRWQLRAKEPSKILVLALGANDGLRGLEPQSMKKNLSSAIELAREKGMLVILAGMRVLPNYGKQYAKRFEAVFLELKEKYNLIFMPFLLEEVAGESKYNIQDRIHPNPEGHQIIAQNLYPYIKTAISQIVNKAE